ITHDNLIRRNEIHDAPRKGIMFGGIRNVVEGNHVHHVNLEQADTGAIGLCTRDLTEVGNVIRHNYLHDVGGYNMLKPGVWAFPSFCWGIYLDDWSSGVTVAGNVVVGSPSGAVHVHSGIDNVIENNILLDSPGTHILFSPIAPKTQNGKTYTMSGNRVRRNVVAGPATSAWLAGRRDWREGIAECDRNLLW
ncbi:MAG: right-handed parallel beta-helix repeat-containing protein, partial [Victivallales bacterium]|nr:right-handed parallel beta-helix repeat-containing protein [Victivallales bacterium]